MSIAEKLLTLRQLVEGKKCRECNGVPLNPRDFPMEQVPCYGCNGTGLDPAFAPMLEVVRVEDARHTMCKPFIACTRPIDMGDCHATGYVTRSWDGLPKGALAGSIEWAVKQAPQGVYVYYCDHLEPDADPDEAAIDAVIEALS